MMEDVADVLIMMEDVDHSLGWLPVHLGATIFVNAHETIKL